MSVDKETEIKYNQIIGTLMQNVLSERQLAGKIVLWDFQETNSVDQLYFNVAAIIADWQKEPMYLQMPFTNYLKFKWKFRKVRKNLRWCNPLMVRTLPTESKTSVYMIMSFVAEYYGIDMRVFGDIQDEFYNWL